MAELTRIRVGGWTVTHSLNLLECDGRSTYISPRTMDLLVYFARHAGEVISVDELIDTVWGGRVVNNAQIYKRVSELRRVLDDHSDDASILKTVPKRGYRLVAPVAFVEPNSTVAMPRPRYQISEQKLGLVTTRVFVLALALLIAGNIDHGSPIRQEAGEPVSANTSKTNIDQQNGIDIQITNSPEAYALYRRAGISDLTPGLPTPLRHLYLDRAITLDPGFAHAYARKANAYTLSLVDTIASGVADSMALAELEGLARQNAEKALELDPSLGGAHLALARLHQYSWRWAEAQQAYETALILSPDDPDLLREYSMFKSSVGDHQAALRMAQRALELSPVEPGLHFRLGTVYMHQGNENSAADAFREVVELNPRFTLAHIYLGLIEGGRGNYEEAFDELRVAEGLLYEHPLPDLVVLVAYGYSRVGKSEDVERVLRLHEELTIDDQVGAGSKAFARLAIGDDTMALKWLGLAADRVKNQEPDVSYYNLMAIRANAFSDPVLERPQFKVIRRALGPSLLPAS